MKLSLKNNITNLIIKPKTIFEPLWQEKNFRIVLLITLAIIIFSLVFLLFFWPKLPSEVPLFYSLPWGKEQLANTTYLFILPLGSILIGFINLSLAGICFNRKENLAAKTLVWAFLCWTLLATFTLIKIVLLII
ncbi:MAG: hypothetical protein V1858_00655 [Candidatus Gottesmanbacteria bacterium]